jgi:hypothetical protein
MNPIVRDILLVALAVLTLLKISSLKVSESPMNSRAFAEQSARRIGMIGAKIGIVIFSGLVLVDTARSLLN